MEWDTLTRTFACRMPPSWQPRTHQIPTATSISEENKREKKKEDNYGVKMEKKKKIMHEEYNTQLKLSVKTRTSVDDKPIREADGRRAWQEYLSARASLAFGLIYRPRRMRPEYSRSQRCRCLERQFISRCTESMVSRQICLAFPHPFVFCLWSLFGDGALSPLCGKICIGLVGKSGSKWRIFSRGLAYRNNSLCDFFRACLKIVFPNSALFLSDKRRRCHVSFVMLLNMQKYKLLK